MELKKTGEESLKEIQDALNIYLQIPENIELFKIAQFFFNEQDLSDLYDDIIPAAKPHLKDIFCYHILSVAFDICFNIHYFHRTPYKVVSYVKAALFKYEASMRALFMELILMIVTSKRRFQFSNQSLDYIISELKAMKLNYATIDFPTGIGEIEYFTGKEGLPLDKDFMTSYLSVKGLIATKEETYKRYLAENYSPELLKGISEILGVEIGFDVKMKEKLSSKFLNWDMVELKPNIAGIGINFNEVLKNIFNRKRKC